MPRSSRPTTPAALTVAPDPRKRLSDGVLVEACIRARLMGMPLLKVEASVVLAPAGLTSASLASRGVPVRTSTRSPRALPTRSRATTGQGLVEAIRNINEGDDLLADVRRNGS
jgi:hypothetical protein